MTRRLSRPTVPVQSPALAGYASSLSRQIRRFGLIVQRELIRHREEILERQLVQEPIAEAAMELYASACVLSRLDAEGTSSSAASLFLHQSAQRIDEAFHRVRNNDAAQIARVSDGLG